MNCEKYRELFSDSIDGEISAEEAEDFRNHLRNCEACREEFGKFRRAQSLLKLLPKKEAPSGLWKAIKEEVMPVEQALVFFSQPVTTFDRFGPREKYSPPVRICGLSFRSLRREGTSSVSEQNSMQRGQRK